VAQPGEKNPGRGGEECGINLVYIICRSEFKARSFLNWRFQIQDSNEGERAPRRNAGTECPDAIPGDKKVQGEEKQQKSRSRRRAKRMLRGDRL